HRFAGLTFGPEGAPALLSDYDRDTRRRRTFLFDPARPEAEPRLVWDRSVQDRYGDPGTPVLRELPGGHPVLWVHEGHLFLTGAGRWPTSRTRRRSCAASASGWSPTSAPTGCRCR